MAEVAKAKGNASFSSGDYAAAIRHFTEAIGLAPTNHILYSNRSAAYASLNQYSGALADAKKTVELKSDWAKGYSRLGAAHLGLSQFDEAIDAYKKGLDIDPNNEALKSGLGDARSTATRSRSAPSNPFAWAFQGPENWAKSAANPITRGDLQQPDFVKMVQQIQKSDTRSATRSRSAPSNPFGEAFEGPEMWAKLTADSTTRGYRQQPDFLKMMQESQKNPRYLAEEEREKGNELFKEQKFPDAVKHYTEAIKRNPKDPRAKAMQDPEIQNILSDPVMRQVWDDLKKIQGQDRTT